MKKFGIRFGVYFGAIFIGNTLIAASKGTEIDSESDTEFFHFHFTFLHHFIH